VDSGKHVSLMAHFSHPAELSTPVVREAIKNLRATGIQIRCQAPLINHINNDPQIWTTMWREQVSDDVITSPHLMPVLTSSPHLISYQC
jgi:L-lysine 2,3-aminomutase